MTTTLTDFINGSTWNRRNGIDAKIVFLFKKVNSNAIKNKSRLKNGYSIVVRVKYNFNS